MHVLQSLDNEIAQTQDAVDKFSARLKELSTQADTLLPLAERFQRLVFPEDTKQQSTADLSNIPRNDQNDSVAAAQRTHGQNASLQQPRQGMEVPASSGTDEHSPGQGNAHQPCLAEAEFNSGSGQPTASGQSNVHQSHAAQDHEGCQLERDDVILALGPDSARHLFCEVGLSFPCLFGWHGTQMMSADLACP